MRDAEWNEAEDRRRQLLTAAAGLPNGDPPDEEASVAPDIEVLRSIGALAAPAPTAFGGLGLGTEAAGANSLFNLLRLIGKCDLALARLFEGHVNAIQLVCRYGTERQARKAARDALEGHVFGVWATEGTPGVRLEANGRLSGKKTFCSGGDLVTRALIPVDQNEGGRLILAALSAGERVCGSPPTLLGMRRTQTRIVDFSGYEPDSQSSIGRTGDYLREPHFSGGAWRTLAAILGGLEAVADQVRRQLAASGRDEASVQRRRFAKLLLDAETARLWTLRCCELLDGQSYENRDAAFYVGLARRVVEDAAYECMQTAQKSVGIATVLKTNPLERLVRDLSTFLRQPALDAAFQEAADRFVQAPLASTIGWARFYRDGCGERG